MPLANCIYIYIYIYVNIFIDHIVDASWHKSMGREIHWNDAICYGLQYDVNGLGVNRQVPCFDRKTVLSGIDIALNKNSYTGKTASLYWDGSSGS